MSRSFRVAALLLTLTFCGCQPVVEGPALPASHPISAQELVGIRDAYHRRIPESRLGLVRDVNAGDKLASVGDVKVTDFQTGDLITFVDSNGSELASGNVESIANNLLVVRFKVEPGGRAPTEGDLAVRILK